PRLFGVRQTLEHSERKLFGVDIDRYQCSRATSDPLDFGNVLPLCLPKGLLPQRDTASKMLGQKVLTDAADPASDFRAVCFDRDVTFAVESHRAVAEVGRPDPKDPVVDDRDLGMHLDRALGRYTWCVD